MVDDVVIVRFDPADPPEATTRLVLLREIAGGLLVAGERLVVNVTVPLKPFRLDTVTADLELAPRNNVTEDGFAAIEKSADVLTETTTLVECDRELLDPVTVTV